MSPALSPLPSCLDTGHPQAALCGIARSLAGLFDPDALDAPDALLTHAPEPPPVVEALRILLDILFPGKISAQSVPPDALDVFLLRRLAEVWTLLLPQIARAIPYRWLGQAARSEGALPPSPPADPLPEARRILTAFLTSLPDLRRLLTTDVQAAYDGDPAALTYAEVLLAYPGFLAIAAHRIAHVLYDLRVPVIPRLMSEWVHTQTGADIHPGAVIGPYFFIDHATGVVIGETAEIGERVKIYQGVTLGAKSFELDPASGLPVKHIKRHPTIRDRVILYANATVLGGDVVVGEDSVIGSNVFLTDSVPPRTLVAAAHPDLVKRPLQPGDAP
jgi:serine O-acetyltransferase